MADTEQDRIVTRGRLLEAAGEVFAEQGFKATTVREICTRAGANVAAVNYHFGDKERLYAAVIESAHTCAEENYPPCCGLPADATPEQRLRGLVRSMLQRLLDQGRPAWHGKLMAREMVDPTPAFDRIVEQGIRPKFDHMSSVVRAIVGPAVAEDDVWRATASVLGQCVFYRHAQPVIERVRPELKFTPVELERLAEHVATFSLAALHDMARRSVSQPAAARGWLSVSERRVIP